MRDRPWSVVAAVGAAVLLGVYAAMAPGNQAPHSRVYTLAAVRARVANDPSGWLGRAVRLRATPARQWCFDWVLPANGTCRLSAPALLAAEPGDRGAPLPLTWGDASPLLALLRRAPLLGALAPRPQAITWGTPGIYRIEFTGTPCLAGQTDPCYQAVLLDAAA